MSAVRVSTENPCCSRSVMLLADGELEPSKAVEVERHLIACSQCRDELDMIRAMRASLRRSCARRSTAAAKERLERAVALEISGVRPTDGYTKVSDVVAARPAAPKTTTNNRLVIAAALAAAACFVFFAVARANRQASTADSSPARVDGEGASRPASSSRGAAQASDLDTVLDQLVALHANPLPPEENNPEQLARLEPYVGVPVQRSALQLLRRNDRIGAAPSFDGARLHMVENSHNAAALHYKLKGHRLTVYVFDPRSIQMRHTRLRPRVVKESPVYVGELRGFSVAAAERSGVGYALASDMDEDNSVQMVASF
jgi:anti-sigma factor RsiW